MRESSQSGEKIIDNPDEASKFFVKLISKKGEVVEKYIHSEDVAEVFDKKVFKTSLEFEAPDLAQEELVRLQKERLEELSKKQDFQQEALRNKRSRKQTKPKKSQTKTSNTTEESASQNSVPDISEAEAMVEEVEADLVPRKRTKNSAQGDTSINLSFTETASEMEIV